MKSINQVKTLLGDKQLNLSFMYQDLMYYLKTEYRKISGKLAANIKEDWSRFPLI